MAIALVALLVIRFFGSAADDSYAIAGLVFLLGALLLLTDWVVRILRGRIRLRPWDAAKMGSVLFLVMLGVTMVIWALLPNVKRDLNYALIHSAIFAISSSLYVTAYRKPA